MRLRSSGGASFCHKRPRDDAKHRAAIEPERAVVQRRETKVAERESISRRASSQGLVRCFNSTRTPCADEG
jgi:hypothetical protein